MFYQIRFEPKTINELNKIPKNDYWRINSALNSLSQNPYLGKKLKGEYRGHYSLRIWPYRVIYFILNKRLIIVIIRIAHRQSIYK